MGGCTTPGRGGPLGQLRPLRWTRRRVLPAALALAVLLLPGVAATARPVAAVDPAALAPAVGESPLAHVYRHGPRIRREVALTFDDGYNGPRLLRIFRILVEERVPATFFVNGAYLRRAPGVWRAIAAAGFPIGNHTYRHRDLRRMSRTAIQLDLLRNALALEATTGVAMAPILRPPYGYRSPESDAAVAAAGYPNVILWDVDSRDSRRTSTDRRVRSAASAGHAGSIVLMHAGPRTTPRVLRDVIRRYRARGFVFVTVPVMLRIPWQPPRTAPIWNSVGVAAPILPVLVASPPPLVPAATPVPPTPAPVVFVPPSAPPRAPADAPRVGEPPRRLVAQELWIAGFTVLALLALIASSAFIGARERRRQPRPAGAAIAGGAGAGLVEVPGTADVSEAAPTLKSAAAEPEAAAPQSAAPPESAAEPGAAAPELAMPPESSAEPGAAAPELAMPPESSAEPGAAAPELAMPPESSAETEPSESASTGPGSGGLDAAQMTTAANLPGAVEALATDGTTGSADPVPAADPIDETPRDPPAT